MEHSRTFWAANYDFVIYVVYGMWNLPVFVISRLAGIDYLFWAPGLLWCKSLGILLCLWTAFIIYKILLIVGAPGRLARMGAFLYLSSSALFLIVFIITQVDSFALLLLVGGFYFYLKGQQRKFILCFAVAMPCKMFALFLFIPLILLREKRICMVMGNIVLVFSLCLFSRIIFGGDPAYYFALGSQSRDAMIQIMDSRIFWGQDVIPFILCYIGICLACYLYDGYKKDHQMYQIPVFCAMAVWISFVCFVNFNSYWVVYLIPFLIIGIVGSGRFQKACCLLEMVFSVGYVGVVVFYCSPLSDTNLVRRLFLSNFCSVPDYDITKYGSLNYMVRDMGLSIWAPLFPTFMIGALVSLLIITSPFLFRDSKRFVSPERSVLWARLGGMVLLLAVILYSYLKVAPAAAYTNLSAPWKACGSDLIMSESWIGQEIVLDETRRLEELQVFFDNPDYIRNNFSSVKFEVISMESGEPIFSSRVGCSMISSGERQDIELHHLEMEAGKPYLLKLTGIPGTSDDRRRGRQIFPYVTEYLVDEEHPAYVNGVEQDYNLYFRIR